MVVFSRLYPRTGAASCISFPLPTHTLGAPGRLKNSGFSVRADETEAPIVLPGRTRDLILIFPYFSFPLLPISSVISLRPAPILVSITLLSR